MQKFKVPGQSFHLSIKASRGLVRVNISGDLDWPDFLAARLRVVRMLHEPPVTWIHDYTNANIRKPHESTSDALKRHQIGGAIPHPNAIIVRKADMGAWQAHLRKVRTAGLPRGLFSEVEKAAAILWAASHARRIRAIEGEPLSSLAGCLSD